MDLGARRHSPPDGQDQDPRVNIAGARPSDTTGAPPVDSFEAAIHGQEPNAPLLTNKEIQILKQCEREAIMNRGLPGGAVGAALAVMAVKSGRLTPHPTYGAIPKAVGMGLLGFFSGRFSYANVCVDRVLHQAPESVLAQRIRKQRGITSPYDDETAPGSLGGSSMAPEGSGYPSSRSDFPSSRASPALSNLPASVPSALPESDPNYAPPSKMRRKNKYGDDVFD